MMVVAWGIGLGLASLMMFLVVLQDVRGPINMFICLICLALLFLETSFGICIGCKLYNVFNKEKAQLCPGNVCAIQSREPIQMVSRTQALLAAVYVALLLALLPTLRATTPPLVSTNQPQEERCRVPEFAKQLGHEEKWKLHNGC